MKHRHEMHHHHDEGEKVHDLKESAHAPAYEAEEGLEQKAHDGHHGNGAYDHHEMMVQDFKRRFWISLTLTVPILALSPMIQHWLGVVEVITFPGDLWLLLGLSSVVYFYGGWPFLTGLILEIRERRPGMMTLVGMAITVAYVYSVAVVFGLEGETFFWETATLIDLMLIGHWIEMRSVMGASRALEELARLMPDVAHRVKEDGSTEDVPVSKLQQGDRVLVKSSEKVPADGEVVDGSTSVDESLLTGESMPVKKQEGDDVIGGSVNGTGSIVVEIRKTGEESYLNQVVRLVRDAQASKSKTQRLADRAAFLLTIVALTVGSATFLAWFFLIGEDITFSISRAVTVMVISCPHALGLAIPLVVAVSTSISAKRGLLIRNRTAFEHARNLDVVVFDKTGTLTEGRFGVTDVLAFGGVDENELIALAAAVEQRSEHPIASGVLNAAADSGLEVPISNDFEALTGKGVKASVNGNMVKILSPSAVERERLKVPEDGIAEFSRQGKTVVYVIRNGTALGALALADVIRPSSKVAVKALHEMGIQVVMLTGDKKEVAEWVAAEIGVDRVIAEVLPEEKNAVIEDLKKNGQIVAMTGDGVNDAPALATADIGIAIGAGTDVAVETADIILVENDPMDVVQIIKLARATYRKMKQNLWYAAGYNIIAIPLAAGVLAWAGIILIPAVGAVLMSLSTIVVAVNARLLR